jgi:hypothetical protein
MQTTSTGAAIATAAALAFLSVAAPAARADETRIQCAGVNSCRGKSACATAQNSCQGQNKCRGKGFLMLTKADCDAAKAKAGKAP